MEETKVTPDKVGLWIAIANAAVTIAEKIKKLIKPKRKAKRKNATKK